VTDLAIQATGLSKRYRVGVRERYSTIREALVRAASKPFRRWRGGDAGARLQWFWALRDINLEVKQGEVLGIIGRNGAGKSTFLKVLTGITDPTEGWADIQGRIGSLLEVGTGFHMELSGRENVFMNGALLGLSRQEIRRRFDDIVAFAEVEAFIDTAVKHYSTGMYMRLAFAVAAHLDPEILIVDEVLAVGDAQFQRKCLGKMQEVSKTQGGPFYSSATTWTRSKGSAPSARCSTAGI
jgi:lipopolysaccharide transport system ATP-binding protein